MMFKEELVKNIKDIGQSLIDNAENIVGDYKYLQDLKITCYPAERDEPPYYNVEHDVISENFVKGVINN